MGRLCSRDGDWRAWALAQHSEKEGRSLFLTSVSYQLWQLVGQILPVEVRRNRTRVTQLAGTGWQENDWGSVLSPPPVPGATLQAEPLGIASTLASSSSEGGRSGAGRAPKLGHRRTQGTLDFPGPVSDTVYMSRCPQEASSRCRAFAYMTHVRCCLSWIDTMTLFMNVHVPQTQGNAQWIFSLKEIPWNICLSYFLGRISAQAFVKACVIFRIFPRPSGVSSFPQACISWAFVQSPPDQFCRVWKWVRDHFSKIKFFLIVFTPEQSLKQILLIDSLCEGVNTWVMHQFNALTEESASRKFIWIAETKWYFNNSV